MDGFETFRSILSRRTVGGPRSPTGTAMEQTIIGYHAQHRMAILKHCVVLRKGQAARQAVVIVKNVKYSGLQSSRNVRAVMEHTRNFTTVYVLGVKTALLRQSKRHELPGSSAARWTAAGEKPKVSEYEQGGV
jgi:hypothetical protein